MVKHIVLWKIRDNDDKQKNIDKMIQMLTPLVGKIEGLVNLEVGYNFNTGSEYDVVLYAVFKNPVALKYYQNHPEHVKCKEFIGSITVDRTAADYFYDEETASSLPLSKVKDVPEQKIAQSVKEVKAEPVVPVAEPKPVAPKAEPVKDEIEVTPVDQRSDSWTCPNCGKVMPNYVGTCGCGEPKPFVFDEVPPAMQPAPTAQPKPVAPAPKAEPVKEEKPSFFKKAEPTPVSAAPTNDSWTCPNCGKVMKNYISTCTCGEPKPFVFDDVSPATQSAPTAQPKPVAPAPKAEPVKEEKPSFFGKKKPEIEVTPVDQRSDSWTCPNCGKVMPNYVGTCGCGEPKPFVFDEVPPAMQPAPTAQPKPVAPAPKAEPAPLPNIAPEEKSAQKMTYEDVQKFNDVEPSLQSYNPQIKQPAAPVDNAPNLGFIQNDEEPSTNSNDYDGFHFDDIPPAAPMRFNDASPMSDRFNQNNNIDVKPMRFDDIPPAAPMKFSDQSQESVAPPAPAKPEKKKSIFTTEISVGKRNKHLFGKKAKEEEVFRQAQEKVNSRKDVPNSGTWTCPNCGKVMPAYVGTCGCGESKPFEF